MEAYVVVINLATFPWIFQTNYSVCLPGLGKSSAIFVQIQLSSIISNKIYVSQMNFL